MAAVVEVDGKAIVLAPQPSAVVSAKKGGRSALIGIGAFVGWAVLDAVVPLITPEAVSALVGPVLSKYPQVPAVVVTAGLLALGEALRNYRKAVKQASEQGK